MGKKKRKEDKRGGENEGEKKRGKKRRKKGKGREGGISKAMGSNLKFLLRSTYDEPLGTYFIL